MPLFQHREEWLVDGDTKASETTEDSTADVNSQKSVSWIRRKSSVKKKKPAFTAQDLAKWTSHTLDDEEEETTDNTTRGASHSVEPRLIVPPLRNRLFYRLNDRFHLEHKGTLYYLFWAAFVSITESVAHGLYLSKTRADQKSLANILAMNFCLCVFSRTCGSNGSSI